MVSMGVVRNSEGRLLLLGDQVNGDIWRKESRALNKVEIGIADTTKNRPVYPRPVNGLMKNNKQIETETHPASILARYRKGFSKL